MNTVENIYSSLSSGYAGQATIRGGVVLQVKFDSLTPDQLEYVRLCSRTDFFQLVWMVELMNQGLTFDESVKRYLTNKQKILI